MAQLILEMSDDALRVFIDSFIGHFGYQSTIDGEKNPQTPEQFTQAKIIAWCRSQVSERQVNVARDAAMAVAAKSVADLVIEGKMA